MTDAEIKHNFELFIEMSKIDPELMSEVMAFNSTALEYDLPRRPKLEKKYVQLHEKAERSLRREKKYEHPK